MENPAIKWGVSLGVASVAISLILYLVNPMWMYKLPGMIVGIILTVALLFMAGKEKRENLGGYAKFGEVFPTIFIAGLIGSVIAIVFGHIMMNFIDPSLIDLQKEVALDSTRGMMEMMGVDEDTLEEAMEQAEEQVEMQGIGTMKQLFTNLIGAAFGSAFFSAIVSLFAKKKNPADIA